MTVFQIIAYWVLVLPWALVFSAKTASNQQGFTLSLLWCLAVAGLVYSLLMS